MSLIIEWRRQMDSFLTTVPEQQVVDMYDAIAVTLLDNWVDANLDEGQMWHDYQVLSMSDSPEFYEAFNKYYHLNPGDDLYLGAS
jgi:hypothetical protein